ncbi:4'-phosphopantetheinyl transferase family protein [Aquabacterium sp. UBA2148]|uniref:4'-phosphopantetheinyl transferase family protein n=1 Tax=Aquabacterium sp. UBA2148 TaxID=1946042 RepID=UPI00257D89A5|nr:4'-phosphopantetheinyl transferase superfamily protein [Aquabacterium sp. UBA2148]
MWDVSSARQSWVCVTPFIGAQVWLIPLPDAEQSVSRGTLACLSEAEHQRALRFTRRHDACRYQAAHAALNVLLAERLHREPAALAMQASAHGKPELIPPSLRFNLSHSAGWALVAMHPDLPLGVDIEVHQPSRDNESLGSAILTPSEWQAWARLAPSQRDAALFNAWTRKEACLKALGTGLLTPPDQVPVSVSPQADKGDWRPPLGPQVNWTDLILPVHQAHSASLAWIKA